MLEIPLNAGGMAHAHDVRTSDLLTWPEADGVLLHVGRLVLPRAAHLVFIECGSLPNMLPLNFLVLAATYAQLHVVPYVVTDLWILQVSEARAFLREIQSAALLRYRGCTDRMHPVHDSAPTQAAVRQP